MVAVAVVIGKLSSCRCCLCCVEDMRRAFN